MSSKKPVRKWSPLTKEVLVALKPGDQILLLPNMVPNAEPVYVYQGNPKDVAEAFINDLGSDADPSAKRMKDFLKASVLTKEQIEKVNFEFIMGLKQAGKGAEAGHLSFPQNDKNLATMLNGVTYAKIDATDPLYIAEANQWGLQGKLGDLKELGKTVMGNATQAMDHLGEEESEELMNMIEATHGAVDSSGDHVIKLGPFHSPEEAGNGLNDFMQKLMGGKPGCSCKPEAKKPIKREVEVAIEGVLPAPRPLRDGEFVIADEPDALNSGQGTAHMNAAAMKRAGIKPGNVVELCNRAVKTAVIIIEDSEAPADTIRLDGPTRRNIRAGANDRIFVRKALVDTAKSVVIAPVMDPATRIRFDDKLPELAKNNIMGRVLFKGDLITIPKVTVMVDDILWQVQATSPRGCVRVAPSTRFEINPRPVANVAFFSNITYDKIGGLKDELMRVRELIEMPLKHPEVFEALGIDPPKGVLLYGPPGTGKTLIAKAIANECGVGFFPIQGPEIVSCAYGGTEANLRAIFEDAKKSAPSIIFIDELDSIAPKRDNSNEMERRMVAQLLTLMDGMEKTNKVVVIGATNRPDSLDMALRRPGRFDREIEIGVPDQKGRLDILKIHTRNMPLENVELAEYAETTHGFVGADLAALVREAAMKAVRRYMPEIDLDEPIPASVLEKMRVKQSDFRGAMHGIEPSALRDVMVEVPKVPWGDVAGLEFVKQQLIEAIEWPLIKPENFKKMGIAPPSGVLLYGPPGCGKTLLAKAIATRCAANFISVKGPELLSMWVGESERGVREVFKKAKQVAPCVVFLDEVDALVPMRGTDIGNRVTDSVVNQLLSCVDGVEKMEGVVIVGATNRPDIIDPAMLRNGRFDRLIFIPPSDAPERQKIFKVHLKKMPLAKDVDVESLASMTEGYTGADIQGLCREAAMVTLRRGDSVVGPDDFTEATKVIKASCPPQMSEFFKKIGERMHIGIVAKKDGKGDVMWQ